MGMQPVQNMLRADKDLLPALELLSQRLDGLLAALDDASASSPPRALDQYQPDIEAAWERIKSGMGQNSDVLLRRLQVPSVPGGPVLIAAIDGLADTQMIDQDIIGPLLHATSPPETWDEQELTPVHISAESEWPQLLESLAAGNTLIFAPGLAHVWVVDTVHYRQRGIQRPQTEAAVRGSEESFNEILLTQKNQIRRRLLTPALRFHDLRVGRLQATAVSLAYIQNLANPSVVNVALSRLQAISVDGVPNSAAISGLIRDHPQSVFPTIRATERLDIVVWHLLQGSVAVLVDGDPFVLLAPAPLVDFYRTSMDYSSTWVDTSFVRLIRFTGWLLGMYLPAAYIALADVNPNLIPSPIYTIMQGSNAGVPFSPLVEVLLMIVIIEILRESALRLPKMMSSTLGTVGAIVVGTAVVRAGLVDPQVIVMMTLTALALFSTPVYELTGAWRVVGLALLLGGALFGVFGIIIVTIWFVGTLIEMQSFGTPYLSPWAPFRGAEWPDAFSRVPWSMMTARWADARPRRPTWRRPGPDVPRPHLRRWRPKP